MDSCVIFVSLQRFSSSSSFLLDCKYHGAMWVCVCWVWIENCWRCGERVKIFFYVTWDTFVFTACSHITYNTQYVNECEWLTKWVSWRDGNRVVSAQRYSIMPTSVCRIVGINKLLNVDAHATKSHAAAANTILVPVAPSSSPFSRQVIRIEFSIYFVYDFVFLSSILSLFSLLFWFSQT